MRGRWLEMAHWFFRYILFGPLVGIFFRIKVVGRENIPRDGGFIVAANHLAEVDSFILAWVLRRRALKFYAKAYYWRIPGIRGKIIRWFFDSTGQISMDRSGGENSKTGLSHGAQLLRDGGVLGVYPEGTRSIDGRLHKGRTGIARTLREARVSVLPVGLIGTGKINPVGSKFPRPGKVTVVFGKPMEFPSHYLSFQDRSVTNKIMRAIKDLSGQEYIHEYSPQHK